MSKAWTGAKVLLLGGAVAAGTVAAVASGMFESDPLHEGAVFGQPAAVAAGEIDGASGGIDYNCSLPGLGRPWLQQDLSFTVGSVSSAVFTSTLPDVTAWAAFLPVPINPDGTALSMDDVYRRLCAVHPQLGGGSLRPVPPGEAKDLICQGMDECHERSCDDSEFPDLYTDDALLASNEARVCLEPTRMYWLPPIPQDLLDALGSEREGDEGDQEGDLTQRWRVELSGEETVEYESALRPITGLEMAAHFDYELRGEFTVKRVDGEWMFVTGRITEASIDYQHRYGPEGAWEIKEVDCLNCDEIPASRNLDGVLYNSGDLWLDWGPITPTIRIDAWYAPCFPADACEATELSSLVFRGKSFSGQVNTYPLLLVDDLQDGQQWPVVTFAYKLDLLETFQSTP